MRDSQIIPHSPGSDWTEKIPLLVDDLHDRVLKEKKGDKRAVFKNGATMKERPPPPLEL